MDFVGYLLIDSSKLNNALNCKYCNKKFTAGPPPVFDGLCSDIPMPQALDCGHSFCWKCIKIIGRGASCYKVKCPTCAKMCHIFPAINHTLTEILEILGNSTLGFPPPPSEGAMKTFVGYNGEEIVEYFEFDGDRFQKAVSCKSCSKPYAKEFQVSRILSCGHSYCAVCLSKLIKHEKLNEIVCPQCCKRCKIPSNRNFALMELIEALGFLRSGELPSSPFEMLNDEGTLDLEMESIYAYDIVKINGVQQLRLLIKYLKFPQLFWQPSYNVTENELVRNYLNFFGFKRISD